MREARRRPARCARTRRGASSPQWLTFRANGISVRYPPSWFATSRQLTPVDDPPQVLAIASYRLPRGYIGADGCQPKEALDGMPPNGAFLFGWEYAPPSPVGGVRARDFPPRPKRFKLTKLAYYECLGRSYMLRFREAGRYFQVHLVLGRTARPTTRATVLRIMDSFRAKRV